VVEAQHVNSTMKLVDTPDEQKVLEDLVEVSKPLVPPECRHLDYLLFTPFRYAPYPKGSRFRRAGRTAGVFYASEEETTAIAETAFYRLLFFLESPGTPWPVNPAEFTAFEASYAVDELLDLTRPPLSRDRKRWEHLTDYESCQALAETARKGGAQAIAYRSVRDPEGRRNLALLTCAAFSKSEPTARRSWHFHLGAAGVQAKREMPREALHFDREAFAADPRIASMDWGR
jgi:hypothetical protein